LIHAQSATTTTATITAVSEAKVSEVSVKGLYNKDGKTLTETTNLVNDLFYVELELKDQYGNVVTDSAKLNEIIITESNSNVVDAASTATVVDVNGSKKVLVALSGTSAVGQNVVTAIALASGKSSSYTVQVAEATRAYNVDVAAPALALEDEEMLIPLTVTDKEGNAITNLDVLKNGTRGVQVTVDGSDVTSSLIVKDGQVYLPQTFTSTGFKSVVVISKATQKVDTLTLDVKTAAKPASIIGVNSTFPKTIKDTSADVAINWAHLRILDQYGREMTTAQKTAAATTGVNGTVYSVVLSETSGSAHDNIVLDTTEITTTAATIDGAAKGTDTIVFTLKAGTSVLAETAFESSVRVTDGTEYVSYQVDEVGTVYDETGATETDEDSYDKEIKVYGILADGSKVRLGTSEYTVKSTFTALATDAADGVIDTENGGVGYSTTYATNPASDVKDHTLTITIGATGEEFNKTVTFSKEAPKVTGVKVINSNDVDDSAVATVAYDIDVDGDFTIADLVTGAASGINLAVTDQYGVSVLATSTTGDIAFLDGTTVSAPTLTISPVKGSVSITDNGLGTASIDDASVVAGEEFNVTITYAGGVKTTVKVIAE
jgi:trimeric autotransporter adhesin